MALAAVAFMPADKRASVSVPSRQSRIQPVETRTAISGRPRANLVRVPFFVGREEELELLAQHLVFGDRRLVTLTGFPGSGKSATAIEFAVQYASAFRWAWRVDLTEVRSIEQLVEVALPLFEDGEPGPVLAILDNAENIAPEGEAALTSLMQGAPLVRFLMTSRRRTGLRAEQVIRLGPLEVPKKTETLPTVLESSAAALFVRRAQAVRPSYRLDESEAARVSSIARRLDGLPLAIELAAFRMASLGSADILSRLTHPLEFLDRAPIDALPRHRSLDLALRSAWISLGVVEQRALSACSVYRDGFGIEEAEAVLPSTWTSYQKRDALEGLVEKSLVCTEKDTGGRMRYRLLGCMREFAARELRSAALLVTRDGRWFRAPASDPVCLSRREKLAALLRCLVDAWEEEPGRCVSIAEIVHHVWRGERMLLRAGINRVYTAVAALRRFGLGSTLERLSEGYRIDPSVPVEIVDPPVTE